MSAGKRVVHPGGAVLGTGDRITKRELDRFDVYRDDWGTRGYAVTVAPKDGREHPLDNPCPVCAGDA